MDEVKDQNYRNSHESYCSPALNKAFKGIDDVNPKVDDLKREFAKKEGEALTLSYKINVNSINTRRFFEIHTCLSNYHW